LVVGGHDEHVRLGEDDGPDGEIGLLDGQPGDERVDVAVAEWFERLKEGAVADLQALLGVAGAEGVPVGAQFVALRGIRPMRSTR
jgi:hypothetical protein